ERFVVHETDMTGKFTWFGISISNSAINEHAQASCVCYALWEIAPHRNAPESLMKKDNCWRKFGRWAKPLILKLVVRYTNGVHVKFLRSRDLSRVETHLRVATVGQHRNCHKSSRCLFHLA